MLNDLIAKFCIQGNGIQYADMIIAKDNFITAVNGFNQLGLRIVEVSWWQHSKIGKVLDDFSMGGPIDKRDGEYFFGETNFGKTFENCSVAENLEQVIKYFLDFVKTDENNLFPAITLDIAFNN